MKRDAEEEYYQLVMKLALTDEEKEQAKKIKIKTRKEKRQFLLMLKRIDYQFRQEQKKQKSLKEFEEINKRNREIINPYPKAKDYRIKKNEQF